MSSLKFLNLKPAWPLCLARACSHALGRRSMPRLEPP